MAWAPASAAVFDLDGVLIDSRAAVRAAARAALAENGEAARTDAALDRLIGPPAGPAFAALIGAGEGSPRAAAVVDAYHRHYERVYLELTPLVGGMREVLDALRLPCALATAKALEFAAPLLDALGIAGRFAAVAAPALAAPDEPKPAIVARALAGLAAAAGEAAARDAVMIGDRSYDVEAAHANGIRAIGVTWGIGDRAELEAAGAERIARRPAELPGLLSRSGARRGSG